jgi:hypothetical protein
MVGGAIADSAPTTKPRVGAVPLTRPFRGEHKNDSTLYAREQAGVGLGS